MSQGQTPFMHQLRDQLAHIGFGILPGVVSREPWEGAAAALGIGALREIFQWFGWGGMAKLKTPSAEDSAVDTMFTALGGLVGGLIRMDPVIGALSLAIAAAAAAVYSLAMKLATKADWL